MEGEPKARDIYIYVCVCIYIYIFYGINDLKESERR
jgi:hypothetical protein